MFSAFASKKCFAATAVLFAVATLIGQSSEMRAAGTSLVVPAPPTTQSGPTMPPGPWEEGKRS